MHVELDTQTATVHVLKIDSRMVAKGAYKQLDEVDMWDIQPFGRVNSGKGFDIEVIGADRNGNLVKCIVEREFPSRRIWDRAESGEAWARKAIEEFDSEYTHSFADHVARFAEFHRLPLIILLA